MVMEMRLLACKVYMILIQHLQSKIVQAPSTTWTTSLLVKTQGLDNGCIKARFCTNPSGRKRDLGASYNTYEGYMGNDASYNSANTSADDVVEYTIGLTHSCSAMEPHETATRWTMNLVRSTKSVGFRVGLMSKTAPVTRLDQPGDVPMSKAQRKYHISGVEYYLS